MAMRAAGRSPKRAGKEFVRNLIGALVVYVPIAAFLTLWPVAPLGGVLIFGGVLVPAIAALITVLVVSVGGDAEAHDGGYDRSWGPSGHPGSVEGGWYDGGGRHHGGGDGGAGDGGGGGF
jgi:hypothetical protein